MTHFPPYSSSCTWRIGVDMRIEEPIYVMLEMVLTTKVRKKELVRFADVLKARDLFAFNYVNFLSILKQIWHQ